MIKCFNCDTRSHAFLSCLKFYENKENSIIRVNFSMKLSKFNMSTLHIMCLQTAKTLPYTQFILCRNNVALNTGTYRVTEISQHPTALFRTVVAIRSKHQANLERLTGKEGSRGRKVLVWYHILFLALLYNSGFWRLGHVFEFQKRFLVRSQLQDYTSPIKMLMRA